MQPLVWEQRLISSAGSVQPTWRQFVVCLFLCLSALLVLLTWHSDDENCLSLSHCAQSVYAHVQMKHRATLGLTTNQTLALLCRGTVMSLASSRGNRRRKTISLCVSWAPFTCKSNWPTDSPDCPSRVAYIQRRTTSSGDTIWIMNRSNLMEHSVHSTALRRFI